MFFSSRKVKMLLKIFKIFFKKGGVGFGLGLVLGFFKIFLQPQACSCI